MTFPDLQFWGRLAETIACEVALVIILAMAAERALQQARWQRAVWEMVLCALWLFSRRK